MNQQLLLQQLAQQRKQQEQQKLLHMSNMESNNWAVNQGNAAPSWTPLGYSGWPNQTVARTSPTHTITPGVGVIRPPPGLESNYNNCQLPAAGTEVGVGVGVGHRNEAAAAVAAASASAVGATASTNNNQSNNHIDGLQNAQDRPQHNIPYQYDPFTSPSSIWSDNWRQRNNHMN